MQRIIHSTSFQHTWNKTSNRVNAERTDGETWTVPNWPPNSPSIPNEEVILTTEATTYNPTDCPPVAETDTQIEWKVISLTFICLVIVLSIALVILYTTLPTATEAANKTSFKASDAEFSLPRPFLN